MPSYLQIMVQNDNFYIEKIRNKEISAYSFLVDKHKDMVFSIALKILRSREDAEELAQDVFVKAYQSLDTFKGESKFSTWLYRIVYNAAISKTRKKKIETVVLDYNLVDNYSTDEIKENINRLGYDEQKRIVDQILKELSPEESVMITLFYFKENSTEEISEIMGMTQSNVKVKLHRLRKKLLFEVNEILHKQNKEIYQ
jgi:RNA polymerase sigma factor (sigma-70 family)